MAISRNLVSTIGAQASPKKGRGAEHHKREAHTRHRDFDRFTYTEQFQLDYVHFFYSYQFVTKHQ